MFGWLFRHSPRSLLDNAPLRRLLERSLDFGRIDAAIASGALYAVSLTASGYLSGNSVSFFQADSRAETWKRTHRAGARTKLGVDHLLASSAIPFIFPAVKIHREYFGDGSMRQLAPVSPAIHLGAERILVVGAGRMEDEKRSAARRCLSAAGADRRPCALLDLSRQPACRSGAVAAHQPHGIGDPAGNP
jgi:NTE family protein